MTLKKLNAGCVAWNKFSNKKLQEKESLISQGLWQGEVVKKWKLETEVNLSNQFILKINLSRFIFAGDVIFDNSTIKENSLFKGTIFYGKVSFFKTIFKKDVDFTHCHFSKSKEPLGNLVACFEKTLFLGKADYRFSNFFGRANFYDATFKKTCKFDESIFHDLSEFINSNFFGKLSFNETVFKNDIRFDRSKFNNGSNVFFKKTSFLKKASFQEIIIDCHMLFHNITFEKEVSFRSLICNKSFLLNSINFKITPDFREAIFQKHPQLDNINITDPIKCSHDIKNSNDPRIFKNIGFNMKMFSSLLLLFKIAPNNNTHLKFRALKILAKEDLNYSLEREYFKQEFRSRRFWKDDPFQRKKNASQFWMSLLYEKLSGFGSYIILPFKLWIAVNILCTGLLLSQSKNPNNLSFINKKCYDVILKETEFVSFKKSSFVYAAHISLNNSFIFLKNSNSNSIREAELCLFGGQHIFNKSTLTPIIPTTVHIIYLIQLLISNILIFFVILGIRNKLRI